jgi:hypothetical protein
MPSKRAKVSTSAQTEDQDSPLEGLKSATRDGGITLVVGAGVSVPRHIPSWDALAEAIWTEVFPERRNPWQQTKEGGSPHYLPQFLPIVFELAYRKLDQKRFLRTLIKVLYANAELPLTDPNFSKSHESLAVLARLIVSEHKRGAKRRINAVITFNADDFIEQAVARLWAPVGSSSFGLVVTPVARSTHSFRSIIHRHTIPIFHVHGYLGYLSSDRSHSDRSLRSAESYESMLVFTDAQYWSTSATAFSFANRIMTSALCEGRCVFIGLSMTDINLLRWLALRTLDRDRDLSDVKQHFPRGPYTTKRLEVMEGQFNRHFWIRPASDDPTGFLTDFLAQRGVRAVEIDDWKGHSFEELMRDCFPRK